MIILTNSGNCSAYNDAMTHIHNKGLRKN